MTGRKDGKSLSCLCIFGKPVAFAEPAFRGLIALNSASVISLLFFNVCQYDCRLLNRVILGSLSSCLNLVLLVNTFSIKFANKIMLLPLSGVTITRFLRRCFIILILLACVKIFLSPISIKLKAYDRNAFLIFILAYSLF